MDYYIFREKMNEFRSNDHEKVKMILNAWYMFCPENFPPSEDIDPLLLSMHFAEKIRRKIEKSRRARDYLISHGPVGCRDESTMKFLLENSIPAYFSGCLTTTLIPNENLRKKREAEYILCVDVSDEVYDYVSQRAEKPVYRLTKNFSPMFGSKSRFEIAKIMLYTYHNAYAVITGNLHTAMPCLAFGTPVCLIDKKKYDGRFDGTEEWVRHCPEQEFLGGGFYDFNTPPDNPEKFIPFRDSLAEKCRAFTGFDSGRSLFEDDYRPDLFSLLSMMAESYEGSRRVILRTPGKYLLKIGVKKLLHKVLPSVFGECSMYALSEEDESK
ncbi:MAG: hypothetical protein IKQ95_04895 [Synergistaceae bacterium]|nr:hypothetical protein [Synergistaceae bacterium]